MKENIVKTRSFKFAVSIVKICRELIENKKDYILSQQLMKSGTSIGANIREADNAESKADFIHKMSIAQKEADETLYWLELLKECLLINEEVFLIHFNECEEIYRIIKANIKKE